MTIKTLKQAKEITGGLSHPSKMPGRSYSTPASRCITGQKLAKTPGTVCSHCYADNRGNYSWNVVKNALERRYQKVMNAVFAEKRFGAYAGGVYRDSFKVALVKLINHYSKDHFRWHDSGDVQAPEHFELIAEVCRMTPKTSHWLPTREYTMLKRWVTQNGGVVPDNLTIRVSAHKIGQKADLSNAPKGIVSSSVDSKEGYACPAPTQGNVCGDCRACWSPEVPNVDYHVH